METILTPAASSSPLDTESARRIGERVVRIGAEFQTAVMRAETGHLTAEEAHLACIQLTEDLFEVYRDAAPMRRMAQQARAEAELRSIRGTAS